ncbi:MULTISPECIES: hypothetical protein [Fusobacterium]|uniref:Uncharacterized protein n=2 Tax=Fusobacterium TaxID=848 RepID=A0A323TWI9_FUSNU|nr:MULTISPECIES: hypothetical protein [Fusobacterium]ALM94375.1 hypothetical protein RO02_07010 [Fusobacterium polymorphum]ALQ41683.1 hypothetical protein RN93_02415 [Fusobacterium polymorphum]MBW9311153.1 hypothetical protein [Fusobacterium nucleatum]PCR85877.1 hypothetical protein CQA79_02135 [Fusobacterium nucleatum]PHI17829.1 hypothetical protein CBG56_02450 [Fusobacterium polymorphum]
MRKKFFIHIILLSLAIFFLTKIPRYENTLLQLNENTKIERDYPIFNDDIALFYLKSTNLKYIIYVKGLKKLDNIWVGNTYSYKEAYEKNSGFKWLEDDSKSFNPEYNREQKEIEYNKSTGYFIIDDKKEIYGLSEEETKKILNISSLNLKNPEKYINKNGERLRLTKLNQDLFGEIFNISISYESDKFEKENPETTSQLNKVIFTRNIIIVYLGINLILCLIFLFKKNIKNIEKYLKIKEKRIWILYKLDFLTLFVYCFLCLFSKLNKVVELNIFVFYYIVIKNFLFYYYLKLKKEKFKKLIVISYLILILILVSEIFIKSFKINSVFYYSIYLFSILYFSILSLRKKEFLKGIALINSLYLVTQLIYLAIVFLCLYIKF